MAEVFISYARANEDVARRVANGLKASGFEAWWDDQLPAHRAYSDIIEQRLRGAAAVVVLWSKDAAQSQWVRAEADFARTENKLVQAQLDGSLPPMPFNQIQCADLSGWKGNRKHRGWLKLVDGVSAVVSGAAPELAEPARAKGRLKMDRRTAIAVVGALLLLVIAAVMFLPGMIGAGDEKPPRVAVLPFKNVGGSDDGLVEGIWEDTRHALSRNPQLIVLGPNTSEELAEKGVSAARKAADYLVEASVRTAPNRVRISTSLVRSKDGAQVWSQTFDRKLDDVVALQSEIAQEIEGRIRGRLAKGGGIKPENIATTGEVYALYSDARSKIRGRDMEQYETALKQLQKVVAMDPNFAPGWATLSVAAAFEEGGTSSASKAEGFARRAIALAPNLAAGHAALGFALDQKGPVAQASLRKAIALDPSDYEALNWLANSLDGKKQRDERFELYSRALEIEPLWWPATLNKLGILLQEENYPAAQKERERLEKLGATVLAGMVGVAIESQKGDVSKAARIGINAFNSSPPDERGLIGVELIFVLLKLGYLDEAQANFSFIPPPAPYLWRNDPKGLDMIEAQHLPVRTFFSSSPLADAAIRTYLLSGRGARLAALYREVASSPAEFEAALGDVALINFGPPIARALQQTGKSEEALRLLAAAELAVNKRYGQANLSGRAGLDADLARIYAVQGRKADSLARLSASVHAGWVPEPPAILTDLALDPPLALLKGDPRFEQSRQKILDFINRERAELGPFHLAGNPAKNSP